MKIKQLVTKIEKYNDTIKVGKKYSKYINKTIFRIGFGIILIFCL